MKWFKHDSDARNSLKLRKVRRKYGADGYAIYWFCLEAIAYDVDKDNLTFDLKEDAETIAFELSIQEKRVEEIMFYLVNVGLFENTNNTITCLKLAERLDKSMTNSPKMRAWLESNSNQKTSGDVMTLSDSVKTCAELDKIRLDKKENIKDITQQAATVFPDSDYLEQVTNLWNSIMVTQPKIKLTAKTTAAKKRVALIKKIVKDYPDYKKPEYFENYFKELATCANFAWQRENNQLNFDQATNINKFERNRSLMMKKYNMEETA